MRRLCSKTKSPSDNLPSGYLFGANSPSDCVGTVLSFCELQSTLYLLVVDRCTRNCLRGRSSCASVSVAYASKQSGLAGPLCDARLFGGIPRCSCGASSDNDSDSDDIDCIHHDFVLKQRWSPTSLKMKIFVERDTFVSACDKLFAGDAQPMLTAVRRALGPIAVLVAQIQISRIIGVKVPVQSAARIGEALRLLPAPSEGLLLGLANYEQHDMIDDWEGVAAVYREEPKNDPILQIPLEVSEMRSQYALHDHTELDGLEIDDTDDLATTCSFLPQLRGFFAKDIPFDGLLKLSGMSRNSLRALGCLRINNYEEAQAIIQYSKYSCFKNLEFVSMTIWDFVPGCAAWPELEDENCIRRSWHAESLAACLASIFPCLQRAQVFFCFSDPSLEYPDAAVVELAEKFHATWIEALRKAVCIDLAIKFCGVYFDNFSKLRRFLTEPTMAFPRLELYEGHLRSVLFGLAMRKRWQLDGARDGLSKRVRRLADQDRRARRPAISALAGIIGIEETRRVVATLFA